MYLPYSFGIPIIPMIPYPVTRPQVAQGAHVIDINLDDGLIDAVAAMTKFVNLLVTEPEASKVPFMIDSSRPDQPQKLSGGCSVPPNYLLFLLILFRCDHLL